VNAKEGGPSGERKGGLNRVDGWGRDAGYTSEPQNEKEVGVRKKPFKNQQGFPEKEGEIRRGKRPVIRKPRR